jgi:hypothetical protein
MLGASPGFILGIYVRYIDNLRLVGAASLSSIGH